VKGEAEKSLSFLLSSTVKIGGKSQKNRLINSNRGGVSVLKGARAGRQTCFFYQAVAGKERKKETGIRLGGELYGVARIKTQILQKPLRKSGSGVVASPNYKVQEEKGKIIKNAPGDDRHWGIRMISALRTVVRTRGDGRRGRRR